MSQNSKLFVQNLIFSGIHGSTGRERLDPQRFQVDIVVDLDISRAASSDNIYHTYDYKHAAHAARHVIENERHILIERIASRIADTICQHACVESATVSLRKLNASQNGIPGITVSRKRIPQESLRTTLDFDLRSVVDTLRREGGVSMPFLTSEYREALLKEAETYTYEKQPEIVGPAHVREEISSVSSLPEHSLFHGLQKDFEQVIEHKSKSLAQYPFLGHIVFNEMSLQLYEKGSIGITPHMDGRSRINMVCIFVLTGHAQLALCDDRSGVNPRYLDTTPGNLIILRAPGFLGSDFRPFHFVTDVTERRIVFSLRQKK